ncbi:MAG: CoA-binding protein [Bacteroidia bacterium]
MPQNKRTLVIGATPNPSRFAYRATHMLKDYDVETVLFGIKKGEVAGIPILNDWPESEDIHTITLYISAKWQGPYLQKMIDLKPKRIIFNPGTENDSLVKMAEAHEIEALEACTLVLLQTNQY